MRQSGLGSSTCPWLIQARPGQHVTVSVMKFSRRGRGGVGGGDEGGVGHEVGGEGGSVEWGSVTVHGANGIVSGGLKAASGGEGGVKVARRMMTPTILSRSVLTEGGGIGGEVGRSANINIDIGKAAQDSEGGGIKEGRDCRAVAVVSESWPAVATGNDNNFISSA